MRAYQCSREEEIKSVAAQYAFKNFAINYVGVKMNCFRNLILKFIDIFLINIGIIE